jgi:hypothetical protein
MDAICMSVLRIIILILAGFYAPGVAYSPN